MALELNGTTGVNLVQDGTVTAADLASTLDLTGKTVTLPAGVGGKVLQVVHASTSTETNTTSTSFVSVNFTATITPSSASNKIVGILNAPVNSGGSANWIAVNIYRGAVASNISVISSTSVFGIGYFYSSGTQIVGSMSGSFLDSPNTTSATTYTVAARSSSSTSVSFCPGSGTPGQSTTATFVLMEIAG
jgi:hypothetical protein